jgi:hypothetical protein
MSSHVLRVRVRQQWALQSHAAARIVDAGPFAFRPGVFFSESRSTIHATAGTVRNDLGALPSRCRAVVCAPDAPRSRSLSGTSFWTGSHAQQSPLTWIASSPNCPGRRSRGSTLVLIGRLQSADSCRASSAMPCRRRRSTHARWRGYACVMSQTSDRGLRSLLKHCTA